MKYWKTVCLMIGLSLLTTGCEKPVPSPQVQTQTKKTPPQIIVEELSLTQEENKETADALMKRLYGKARKWKEVNDCWLGVYEVQLGEGGDNWEVDEYCMQPVSLQRVTIGDESRLYLQTAGPNQNYEDYFWGVGFLILDEQTQKVIAKEPTLIFPMPPKHGSAKLDLVQLSSTGYFGWMGVTKDVDADQKQNATPAIYAPKGKEIVKVVGNLPASDDVKQLTYRYPPDTRHFSAQIYPLTVIETHVLTGKTRTFTATFDPKKWEYHCQDKRCRYEGDEPVPDEEK